MFEFSTSISTAVLVRLIIARPSLCIMCVTRSLTTERWKIIRFGVRSVVRRKTLRVRFVRFSGNWRAEYELALVARLSDYRARVGDVSVAVIPPTRYGGEAKL